MNTRIKFFLTFSTLAFLAAGAVGAARASTDFSPEGRGQSPFLTDNTALETGAAFFYLPASRGMPAQRIRDPFTRRIGTAGPNDQIDPHWGPAQDATSTGN